MHSIYVINQKLEEIYLFLPHFIDNDNYSLKHEFSLCLPTIPALTHPIKQIFCYVAHIKIIISWIL